MLQTVYSAGINGIDGFSVTVECNSANRLAKFEVVGLPDAAVKEARERIKAAAENSGYGGGHHRQHGTRRQEKAGLCL